MLRQTRKTFFNENEYNRLYGSGSAPPCVFDSPEMHKFSSSDSFAKFRPIFTYL